MTDAHPSFGTIVLTPTSNGSFQDTQGGVWTLAPNGQVMRNGVAVPGGEGTGTLEIIEGTVYGRNGTTGAFYNWTGSAWAASAVPDPAAGSTIASIAPGSGVSPTIRRATVAPGADAAAAPDAVTTPSSASSTTLDAQAQNALVAARTALQDALAAVQAAIQTLAKG